ncbi:arylamine N-acetyltransferase [Sphingomonas canadensis]|uniref:Arylamine N-acetyltransferase n=1 Tax=Sphingomonas canadensis TaxID=1219257 RepID=A0ABW3H5V1_9SPHN|nr:arylamine N-acetyltransferase [Sphingomonas canadensis]MCW3836391.1 arylamine N-acetyltransferase [Sphingomonas canadensis]
MELDAYLDRIGYAGPRTPDLATLEGVMRAHVAAVPFENLDVQLGRRLDTALPAIYAKIVGDRRGGWCFEQNGLLGWALAALGFRVTRLSGGVMRERQGEAAMGNHLALKVSLERDWLVDAGFGGSQAAPVPLAEGAHEHPPYRIWLAREPGGHWRFAELFDGGSPFTYDFLDGPADEALLAAKCAELQDIPESPFVQNLVVQRRVGDRHRTLRGRVFSERGPDGVATRTIGSADELVAVLADEFGLRVPAAAGLWDAICERHAALFPETAGA